MCAIVFSRRIRYSLECLEIGLAFAGCKLNMAVAFKKVVKYFHEHCGDFGIKFSGFVVLLCLPEKPIVAACSSPYF